MSLVAIGLNHRSVPLELLERMTIEDSRLPKALHDVVSREHVSEAVVLSTCNRTEIYVVAERFHGAYADVRDSLAELAFLPPEAFADHLYVHYDIDATRHLFEVAAGLDSAVVGESEILGQVRHAWERARSEHTAGPALNALFRHAIGVGKRARTETGISRNIASVSTAAVAMATARLDGLDGRRILVLGAGDMGAGMTRAIVNGGVSHGAAEVGIANRTWDRAVELAADVGPPARAVRLADLERDAVARSTCCSRAPGAQSIMLEHGDLQRVMAARDERAAADRRCGRAPRRRSGGRRAAGCDAARHGRPAGVRRVGPARARARGRGGQRHDRRGDRPLRRQHVGAVGGAAGGGHARAGRDAAPGRAGPPPGPAGRSRRARSSTPSRPSPGAWSPSCCTSRR